MLKIFKTVSIVFVALGMLLGCGSSSDGSSPVVEEPPSTSIELVDLSTLHTDVRETSGLAQIGSRLYTHNDSGGTATLYEVNATSGTVIRSISVIGADNVDWEDLACDDTYLYIGDIGNNDGSRSDLKIYKVLKDDINNLNAVNSEVISFSYADQVSFVPTPLSTPYDAEALIVFEGKLYLFTKDWTAYKTKVYPIPTVPGNYMLTSTSEKVLEVLVTGASIDTLNNSISLIGYSDPYDSSTAFKSMLLTLKNVASQDLFSADIQAYEIENPQEVGQVESVEFLSSSQLYISAEGITIGSTPYPAKLYQVELGN